MNTPGSLERGGKVRGALLSKGIVSQQEAEHDDIVAQGVREAPRRLRSDLTIRHLVRVRVRVRVSHELLCGVVRVDSYRRV